MAGLAGGLRARLAREYPSASCARTRSPSITSRDHEGSSHRRHSSATIYGSHRLLTRMGIAWTSRVQRTLERIRSIRADPKLEVPP
jgi:hypothetical protein